MLNIAVYDAGCIEAIGIPNLFFSADDVRYIIRNKKARKSLVGKFGEGVCIGTVGKLTNDGFIEDDEVITIPEDEQREGDFGFYGRL